MMIIALIFLAAAVLVTLLAWGFYWRTEAELERKHKDRMWKRLLEVVDERDRYADVLSNVHKAVKDGNEAFDEDS